MFSANYLLYIHTHIRSESLILVFVFCSKVLYGLIHFYILPMIAKNFKEDPGKMSESDNCV